MPECVNHPGKEGVYRCSRCRKYFCPVCVELIGDRAYCYECLKEIVKESRENVKKSLTLKVGISSLVSLLMAIVSFDKSVPILEYIYKNSTGIYEPVSGALVYPILWLLIGIAFLVLSVGLASTRKWTYRYGIAISVVAFVVEVFITMKAPGGLEAILNSPQSEAGAFFIIIIFGSFILFISILSSRRELLGW